MSIKSEKPRNYVLALILWAMHSFMHAVLSRGRGYCHTKVTGCSSDILKETPKRYQDLVLWAWLQENFTAKRYQLKQNISQSHFQNISESLYLQFRSVLYCTFSSLKVLESTVRHSTLFVPQKVLRKLQMLML